MTFFRRLFAKLALPLPEVKPHDWKVEWQFVQEHGSYMYAAEVESRKSTCKKGQVGAVLVSTISGRFVSGFNHVEGSIGSCCENDQGETLPTVLHAEAHALKRAKEAFSEAELRNLILYTTRSPCLKCAKLIIDHDIRRTFYRDIHTTDTGIHHLINRNFGVSSWAALRGGKNNC